MCAYANVWSCMLMTHKSHIRNLELCGHSFIYIYKIYLQIWQAFTMC